MGRGQAQQPAAPPQDAAVLTVQSSLVLVPALVKTKTGELVFSLSADDFTLTDNGVPQRLRLETDTDAEPLALVVLVQTGGAGATHLADYRGLEATIEAVIGNVPHRIALVSLDSTPHVEEDFTADTATVAAALAQLEPGDPGAALLDGLRYSVDLLRRQPTRYRRAILTLTETADNGSETTLDEALRAVSDTNTAIYSFGFSSTRAAVKREARKLPIPNHSTAYSSTPYAKGGCMSREPDADPDAHGSRALQALDCAGDLLPPVRLARLAFTAARESMARNVPETVARLSGGEYIAFKDNRTLSRGLVTISNDVPNHYVLSFVPSARTPGLHSLELRLNDRPAYTLESRTAYWIDSPAPPRP